MKKRRVKAAAKPVSGRAQRGLKRSVMQKDDDGPSDFVDSDVDPDDFYHDEIDDFHAGQEKILLGDDKSFRGGIGPREEEVMPITDDEDDLEDEEEDEVDEEEFAEDDQASFHKSDMESDLEDKENSDDDLPNLDAWGKKKSTYYNADFVDKDWGKTYREEDEEAAAAEEEGAIEIQQKFGTTNLSAFYFDDNLFVDKKQEQVPDGIAAKDKKIVAKEGKFIVNQLKQTSPEFFLLSNDFKQLMKELIERISPLHELVKDGRIQGIAAQYIAFKYNIILHYCMNISFYMAIKSRGNSVQYHPVMKRASAYKTLLNQLQPLDEKLETEIGIVLDKLKNGEDIEFNVDTPKELQEFGEVSNKNKGASMDRHASLPVKRSGEEQRSPQISNKSKRQKVDDNFTTEMEKEVASLYMNIKEKQRNIKLPLDTDEDDDDDVQHEEEEEDYEENMELENSEHDAVTDEKRTITYQISKNKGLLPYRKKEYRNPRVRNRMKYQRAKIRRKGQVREVRREITKYGGELTGIRTDIARSVKIK